MNALYALKAANPAQALDNLRKHSVDELAVSIVNDALNDFIRSQERDSEDDPPVPYQGWYWRDVDFFNPYGVTIAGGAQIGVCMNNKWGYPQRSLTEAEQGEFLALVWAAWIESRKGGQLSEINKATMAALALAGEFIAGLDVPEDAS